MPPAPLPLSGKSLRTTDSPITYFIQKALENPGLISFAAGLVDEGSLPAAEVGAAVAQIMADPVAARAALQYGSTQGLASLREKAGGDLDPVVEQYLGESYRAAGDDLWVSATFMLGAASEKALYLMAYKVADLIKDPKETKRLEGLPRPAR